MTQFKTVLITEFAELDRLAEQWNQLQGANPRRSVFTSYAWTRASWKAYGGGRKLLTPVVLAGPQVVGILPLGIQSRTLTFLGAPRSDYNDLICEPGLRKPVLVAALESMLEARHMWDCCRLENLRQDSLIVTTLDSQPSSLALHTHLEVDANCPRVLLGPDRGAVLRSILRKKSMIRNEKQLCKLGDVSFCHEERRDAVHALLPCFFQQHTARRAMVGQRSLFFDDRTRTFFESLVEEFDPSRELRFSVVRLDGRPLAFHFGFEFNSEFTWYKPAFDVDWWRFSPGEILIKKLFEYVHDRDVDVFDFTLGDEAFKGRFANDSVQTHTLYAYARGARGRVFLEAHRVKSRFKRQPLLAAPFRPALSSILGLRRRLRRAVERHGVLRLWRQALMQAWRALFFARNEVLVYAHVGTVPHDGATGSSRESMESDRLSELALLAAQYPDCVTPARLGEARRRLNDGDEVYVTRRDDGIAHVTWMGTRDVIADPEFVGEHCRVDLPHAATVIFDAWTIPSHHRKQPCWSTFQSLARRASANNGSSWLQSRDNDPTVQRGLERIGFTLRYRMRRVRWFGCISRSHVLEIR